MSTLAVQYPIYQPAMRIIASITNSFPVTITTTFAHQYSTGLIVRLNVPPGFGMTGVNGQYAPITVIDDTTFTMPLDTTYYDPFVISSTFPSSYQSAQVTPIGEINSILTSSTKNVLPYSAS